MTAPIFHVALAVDDIATARDFYLNSLGCKERTDASGSTYSVINFFGAQLVIIQAPDQVEPSKLDSSIEPVKHFGIIMEWTEWHSFAEELKNKGLNFRIKPNVKDHPYIGEVGNLFVTDPSGNYIEFKSYRDKSKVL